MSNVIKFQSHIEICMNELLPELLDRLDRSIELCMMLENDIPEIVDLLDSVTEAFNACEELHFELQRRHGTV